MNEDYFLRVCKIADVKYMITQDIVEAYVDIVAACYEQEFTPRKCVEVIATELFG